MLELVAGALLGLVLVAGSAAKVASPRSSQAALSTFGVRSAGARWGLWAALVVAELALAVGVVAGLDFAAWAAAALMAAFAAALILALARGRAGAPCACFGARSTVSPRAVGRNLVLAAAFVALALIPDGDLTTEQWLGAGLVVTLVLCLALGIAVLALAREIGMLRLRLGPASALEIPEEGPPLGSRADAIDRLPAAGDLGLAVFVSEACPVCAGLAPGIESLAREPSLSVATFDEHADGDVWRALDVPGSPYAVALDRDRTVLAKGTFNNLAQLESVVATAERRRAGGVTPAPAEAVHA